MKRLFATSPVRRERTQLPPPPSQRGAGFDHSTDHEAEIEGIRARLDELSKQAAANAEENARRKADQENFLALTGMVLKQSLLMIVKRTPDDEERRTIEAEFAKLIDLVESAK